MQKETNQKSNILVCFVIFLLSFFIILPPVFRVVYKDTSSKKSSSKTTTDTSKKESTLQCKYNKYDYSIKATTSFKNEKATKIELVYTNNAYDTDDKLSDDIIKKQDEINKEIEYFSDLLDAEYSNEGFTTKIVLTDDTFESNKNDKELAKRFESKDKLKEYYEGLDYKCN